MLLALVTVAQLEKILLFLVVLSILVVLHEYGHFILARINGVRVLEFAVGMGPKVFSVTSKRSGTVYSLRSLPIGGFCQMKGEDGKTEENEQQLAFRTSSLHDEDNFQAKRPLQRLAIVLAGPVANFILTLAILLVAALAFGVQSATAPQPVIGPLTSGFPAERSGIKTGDRLVAIDGKPVLNGAQAVDQIHNSKGLPLAITFSHDGARRTVKITGVPCPQATKLTCIGFNPIPEYRHVPLGEALAATGDQFLGIAMTTIGGLGLIVSHPQQYAGQVSGVVGMGQAAMTIQDFGWGYYFNFAAIISFALGLFNLLPIPALDGGRLAFIIAEMVRGKPVDPEKEAMVHIAGFGVLLALMLVINVFNAIKIFQGKGPF